MGTDPTPEFLSGGGRMGAMIRAFDWAATPLGPAETWPQSLRTTVSTCLNCSFPLLIGWGPLLTHIYNDAYVDILGTKHPRALGRSAREVWPEIWDTVEPLLADVVERGEAFPGRDLRLVLDRHGAPEECYFSFSYSPIRDESGRVGGVFCPVVETTGRVLAERRAGFLLELEARLRDIQDPVEVKAVASEMLGTYLGADQVGYAEVTEDRAHLAIEGIFVSGVHARQRVTLRYADYGPAMIADLLSDRIVQIDDVGQDPRTSDPATQVAYGRFGVAAVVNVPLIKAGRMRAMLFVHQRVPRVWSPAEVAHAGDVAERTWSAVERAAAEQALRLSEAKLRSLNENLERQVAARTAERDRMWRLSTDILLVARMDTVITAVNPAGTAMLGWGEDELVGRSFLDFVHEEDAEATLAAAAELSQGRTILQFYIRCRHRDGGIRWVAWSAAPDDGLIHAVGRDTTAERDAAAQLEAAADRSRQAQRMEVLGQLAGGIAHDFNNVLQAVAGGLKLIRKRADDAATVRKLADMVVESAARGAAITGRLLSFARQGELQSAVVDTAGLIEGLAEMLAHTLGPNIEIRAEAAADLPPLYADRAQLETVLVNLAVNARDAMPGGGVLTIHAGAETVGAANLAGMAAGDYVRITMADSGCGMDAPTLARAGEPFFTTKPMGQGTGLGLAMARGFSEQSGGGLAISSAPGRGTRVALWLPQASAVTEGAVLAVPYRGEDDVAAARVLLVDDDAMVRMTLGEHLTDAGYRIDLAADGLSALARLDAGGPVDLLVTDFAMPGMNGLALIREARRRLPGLPVILLTGYADTGVRDAVAGSAASDTLLLRKPVSPDELALRAVALLRGQEAGGEAMKSA